MVPLTSWSPAETGFHEWLEGRLAIDYPELSRQVPTSPRRTMARALLEENRILIVLDGLDEIPAESGVTAIEEISEALSAGQGLVLASQTRYFRDAMAVRRLPGMAAVELQPLAIEAVVNYLKSASPGAAPSWARILPDLQGDDPPAAAQALTTPLMATLARTFYDPVQHETPSAALPDPKELLDREAFPEPAAVRNHLVDVFLDAAYRQEPESRRQQARRALTFLAHDLDDHRGRVTNLDWWQLDRAAPQWLSGIVVGILAGTAGAIGLGAVPRSAGIGLATAASVGLAVRLLAHHSRLGGRTSLSSDSGIGSSLGGGLLGGLAGTLIVICFGVVANPGSALTGALAACLAVGAMRWFWAALAGGFAGGIAAALTGTPPITSDAWLVNGIGVGLAVGCAAGITRHNRPARGRRFSHIGLAVGIAAGLTMGIAAWLQAGELRGLVVGTVTVLGASTIGGVEAPPANTRKAATPKRSLSADRSTFWVNAVLGGLVVGVSTGLGPRPHGPGNGLEAALEIGITNTVTVGLAFGFVRATYGRFFLARTWLAMRGDLPWRLMTFLRRAHEDYGVLRQNGASYEFRATDLQHRLAEQPLPPRRFPARRS
ncbi:MAG TPA: hypothetical protein VN969_08305 [Streptosporangiaceae bacterium]|nr:hypothetical protein [Streptosporangiaceae bacterium]